MAHKYNGSRRFNSQKNQSSNANSSIFSFPFTGDSMPKTNKVLAMDCENGKQADLCYTDLKIIDTGAFGIVYSAVLSETRNTVAIKKVHQDKRYKNRELDIMKVVNQFNVVRLFYYFYSQDDRKDGVFLNLVLEFLPSTVYKELKQYLKQKQNMPLIYVKLYAYQMFRALNYIHQQNICHRDIKPQNLLVNPDIGVLKICDFGSAKVLVAQEKNVSYICSRYYRAPELIFGSTNYDLTIDIWSAGCVLAEMILGHALFPGESSVDQLVEIIKILGTPSADQIAVMNPDYVPLTFPCIKSCTWDCIFHARTPKQAIKLVSEILLYEPCKRITPLAVCAHSFFDELRDPETVLPSGKPVSSHLFEFHSAELPSDSENLMKKIIPEYIMKKCQAPVVTCNKKPAF